MKTSAFCGSLFFLAPLLAPAEELDYQRTAQLNSFRVGTLVYRYVRLYEDPCLYIEALSPADRWKVFSSKKICAYEGKDFYKGYASAEFRNFNVQAGTAKYDLKLITLPPVEEKNLKCLIEFEDEKFNDPICMQ